MRDQNETIIPFCFVQITLSFYFFHYYCDDDGNTKSQNKKKSSIYSPCLVGKSASKVEEIDIASCYTILINLETKSVI